MEFFRDISRWIVELFRDVSQWIVALNREAMAGDSLGRESQVGSRRREDSREATAGVDRADHPAQNQLLTALGLDAADIAGGESDSADLRHIADSRDIQPAGDEL